jgi:SAM-dependent methyltransferase
MIFDKVVKHELGYYEVKDKPSIEELKEFYSKQYYQDSKGAYQAEYSDEEILFFKNKTEQKYNIILDEFDKSNKKIQNLSLLDVGCGEGWALDFFKNKKWDVLGLDYSNFGCSKCNPNCIDSLIVGDIYESLSKLKKQARKFDVILLLNVLEHVLNPIELLNDFKNVISENGILVIDVPNDFSDLQLHLLNNGIINRPFWILIPDHISYFTKDSLSNIGNFAGWKLNKLTTGYPIDLNLFNVNTNYIMDKTKGKAVHEARIKIENFLHEESPEKANLIFEAMASAGIGRNLIAFMTVKK